jgi:hypothetical protein
MVCAGSSSAATVGCNGHGVCKSMWELAELAVDSQGTLLAANSYGVYGTSVRPWVPIPSARAAQASATWDFDMIHVRLFSCLCVQLVHLNNLSL